MRLLVAILLLVPTLGWGYRPANYDGPPWTILAEKKTGFFRDTVILTINGEEVGSAKYGGVNSGFTIDGTFDGRYVLAECKKDGQKSIVETAYKCDVFVESERAAQLSF